MVSGRLSCRSHGVVMLVRAVRMRAGVVSAALSVSRGTSDGAPRRATMESSAAGSLAALATALTFPPATGTAPTAGLPAADATSPMRPKRRVAPKIDIDEAIARHLAQVKEAAKLVHQARKHARNERRKKQRLMKKASSLTPEDLERIAVLKRCGLWAPSIEGVAPPAADLGPAVASEVPAAPAAPPAAAPSAASAASGEDAPSPAEAAEDGM